MCLRNNAGNHGFTAPMAVTPDRSIPIQRLRRPDGGDPGQTSHLSPHIARLVGQAAPARRPTRDSMRYVTKGFAYGLPNRSLRSWEGSPSQPSPLVRTKLQGAVGRGTAVPLPKERSDARRLHTAKGNGMPEKGPVGTAYMPSAL